MHAEPGGAAQSVAHAMGLSPGRWALPLHLPDRALVAGWRRRDRPRRLGLALADDVSGQEMAALWGVVDHTFARAGGLRGQFFLDRIFHVWRAPVVRMVH